MLSEVSVGSMGSSVAGISLDCEGPSDVSDISTDIADFGFSLGVGVSGRSCSSTDNSGSVVGGVIGFLAGASL